MIHYPVTSNDLQDLPYPSNSDVDIFIGPHDEDIFSFDPGSRYSPKVWSKPKFSTMTYILAIGGGGGGGGGWQRPDRDPGGGGGGGGTGGIATLLIPSFFLPDTLYIIPGKGGLGGAASSFGNDGGISYVLYSSELNPGSTLLASNDVNAGPGGDGNDLSAGTAGTAATISTVTVGAKLGIFSAIAGQNGAAGGNPAGGNGASVTAWGTIPLSGGAGGAGTEDDPFNGGGITAGAATNFTYINWPTTAGAVAAGGGSGAPRRGGAGVNLWKPFRTSGGGGGGTNDDNGGDGNSGGIGSGGGGGGAGQAGTLRGGNGGPGMVMIISW
jgi:hypothetical protein